MLRHAHCRNLSLMFSWSRLFDPIHMLITIVIISCMSGLNMEIIYMLFTNEYGVAMVQLVNIFVLNVFMFRQSAFMTRTFPFEQQLTKSNKSPNFLRTIVDSGCSRHISNIDSNVFKNYRSHRISFGTATSKSLTTNGIGDIGIIPNIHHCPDILESLISVSQLCDDFDGAVIFTQTDVNLIPTTSINTEKLLHKNILHGKRNGNLYVMDIPISSSSAFACSEHALVADAIPTNRCTVWHKRLNHLNLPAMHDMKKTCPEMIWTDEEEFAHRSVICSGCAKGKLNARPLRSNGGASRPCSKPGELIFVDLYFSNIPSVNGNTCGLIIVDAFSRTSHTYFGKTKDACAQELQTWLDDMRRRKVNIESFSVIRSDGGGEFISSDFLDLLTEHGIREERSPPYCHVSVAERIIRTIKENTRAFIEDAYVNLSRAAQWYTKGKSKNPYLFWTYAARHACNVMNCLPFSRKINTSKYELFFGSPPDITRLKVFGCLAYAHVPATLRKSMDNAGIESIYFGFDPIVPGTWKVLKTNTSKFVDSYSVVFNENLEKQELKPYDRSDDVVYSNNVYDYWDEDGELIPERPYGWDQTNWSTSSFSPEEPLSSQAMLHNQLTTPFHGFDYYEAPYSEYMLRSASLAAMDIPLSEQHNKRHSYGTSDTYFYHAFAVTADTSIPRNAKEAIRSPEWKLAYDTELKSLIQHEILETMHVPDGAKLFDVTWIFKIKESHVDRKRRYKARCCFRGDRQIYGLHYDETFAPVVRHKTLRALIAVSAQQGLHLHNMDVDTAFLYGIMGDDEPAIYVKIPDGYPIPKEFVKSGKPVCGRLRKALYGLRQAPRLWNQNIDSYLKSLGFNPSQADPCLYIRTEQDGSSSYIALFVDDLIIATKTLQEMKNIKKELASRYNMKDLGELQEILGMKVFRNWEQGTITLSQEKYALDILEKFNMSSLRPVSTPMAHGVSLSKQQSPTTAEEIAIAQKFPYREIVGSLMYLMTSTRPDIAYAVGQLSRFNDCHGSAHHAAAKHLLRYLRGTYSKGITFGQFNTEPIGFCDSSWASDKDNGRSVTGYVFFMAGGPVSWRSKTQSTVALSTAQAEYQALCAATQEAIHQRLLSCELDSSLHSERSVIIFEDNQACIAMSENPINHEKTKHIFLKYHFIRECVLNKRIEVLYLSTKLMIADLLTKPTEVHISRELGPSLLGCTDVKTHVSSCLSINY